MDPVRELMEHIFRDTKAHYFRYEWPSRSKLSVGRRNVKSRRLVDSQKTLSRVQNEAWNSLFQVIRGFLGNRKAENYEELVKNLVACHGAIGCRISLKVKMIDAHLDAF
ncbi:hypothetical protein LAZ67_19002630 [Cordylochernes scorpioides]|uniref:Uncharacterized protein n=1 Tax=Cordylochernes scorpioides TaxID=51811 RepID=A0ABY6LIR0_9ARAC|nr:hypothetical protein LAZ67_19002630 [Cordylochernes scorpioides]